MDRNITSACHTGVIAEDVDAVLDDVGGTLTALRGTTLLVTGAQGFLCSYFVETVAALNDRGLDPPCRVVAADNLRTGVSERLSHLTGRPDIVFRHVDVSRPVDFGERVDWIIHGASVASPSFYRRHPLETIDVNAGGTRHMLNLARSAQAKGMLYLSTSEIYGDPDASFIPTPEDYRGYVSCTGPRACYDESKRLAETLCQTYLSLYEVPVKVVRPFNVYGPGQRLDDGRIIPDLMRAALNRQPLVLFSDGRASRAFCYVSDAIRAMWRVLIEAPKGAIFNVGNDESETTIVDVARHVQRAAGPPTLPTEHRISPDAQYLTDNPRRRLPDLSRLRGCCSWQPKVTLADGLARTLRSYQEASRL